MKNALILLMVCCSVLNSFDLSAQKKDKHKQDQKKHSKGDEETTSHLTVNDACQKEVSLEKIKGDITPYRFDKVNTTKISYKSYDKVWMVAIPLFHSTNYKFIVNSEGLPTNAEIKISDKPLEMSAAKTLHQSSDKHFSYELPSDFEGTRIYVSIKVPADPEYNNGIRNKGCVVIGAGYKNLDF